MSDTPNKPNSGTTPFADRIAEPVIHAGVRLHEFLQDPRLLERIPGRSISIAALVVLGVAILLDILPSIYGVGLWWSLMFLFGGLVVACQELRASHTALGRLHLPRVLNNPLLPPLFAALVAVQAFQLLSLSLLSLLWTAAAILLVWDQWRKSFISPGGFGRYLDVQQLGRGYRLNLLIGIMICFASLFLKWGAVAPASGGYFAGGMRYGLNTFNATTGYYEYGFQYDSMMYLNPWYLPGFEYTGRNLSYVIWVEMALFALVVWAAYRTGRSIVGAVLAVGITGWWALRITNHPGVWVFFAGLLLIDSGVWFLFQNREQGLWEITRIWQRLRQRVTSSTPPPIQGA